jgi:hypothetical protein
MTTAEFVRLPCHAAGGVKLCGRRVVNPSLWYEQSIDPDHFLYGLRARLGEPDPRGDSLYSYSERDTRTGVEFEAYSAQSGPAYGGRMDDFSEVNPRPDPRRRPGRAHPPRRLG